MPVITLTTDFGTSDAYVGVMKGVILTLAPHVTLVDISHAVPPQDVRTAAFLLYQAELFFPADTIHVVVVDPGVGSARRAVAVRTHTGTFVAPDNGVLTYVLHHTFGYTAYHLTRAEYWLPRLSATFHGRDIFAPVAARLANGMPLSRLGEPIDDLVCLPVSKPEFRTHDEIIAHVLHVDRFGNLILDITADQLPEAPVFEIMGHRIVGLRRTYSEAAPGELLAYVGSTRQHVEIACSGGHAAGRIGAQVGTPVIITRPAGHVSQMDECVQWTNS
ncbi:MAG: SAM-dependent chlorinase/fluorinase [Anaerolineae bacterium]|nr:SAM-dependent chlorinase/fluorinase [Anaerolineae bacterium]MDW8070309.1 SAM-dependent chlorinase/fluorinase [Anaerolineae bacterium]